MSAKAEFTHNVADAYDHLYDLVHLRTHPLADLLLPAAALQRREKARELQRILLEAIDEMDPGPQSSPFSHEWRRHRLMVLHYVDGLDPQAAADELGISRRHYYREHEVAVDAIAGILWDRLAEGDPRLPQPPGAAGGELDLLRQEAALLARADRHAEVAEVCAGVLALLEGMLQERQLTVRWRLPEELPGVPVDRGLLRQVLLALLGYLIAHAREAAIELRARLEEDALLLSLAVEPAAALQPLPPVEAAERLAALEEMAALGRVHIRPLRAGAAIAGFEARLPADPQRTILVVDDNEDVLALFQRYLSLHHYRAVTAQTAEGALAQASRLHPYAITLDLMMPGRDGWDLLQVLLNQPDTRDIPIIVCSVLKQRDLALALGAAAFLKKPVTEQDLLEALRALGEE